MSNKKVLRNPDGTLAKGTRAMNPGGRPRGIERRMRELVEAQVEKWDGRSLDGWEALTMLMYKVAMGKRPPGDLDTPLTMKNRMEAVQFLFDRVHGKAKIQIESDTTIHNSGLADIDIENLSADELDALEAHVELLAAKAAGHATSRVVDISPADVIEHEDDENT